ncbi:MAG: hypothetical protein NW224_12975 [Leptolyngbyaceae cyanobacterium bins.302]|nr:hypothetical protein [Leptolyngbyaceae cyanobacterium bins.302]
MNGYGNDQGSNYSSGYSSSGYGGNGYGSDEEISPDTGYGKSGYGGTGYNTGGYSTDIPDMPSALHSSSAGFDPNPEDSSYTPPDVWSSGYQENVYDEAVLLDTPYTDTADAPNRGGAPAYESPGMNERQVTSNPATPFIVEQSERSLPGQQSLKAQPTKAQKARELEQLRRSQPAPYRSKVFDVELEL